MPTYKLQCSNQSSLSGVFAIYPGLPDVATLGSVLPVAWLARPSAPNAKVTFTWTTAWSFVWGEFGVIQGGSRFEASQFVDCDPLRANMIDLAKNEFGSPVFQNLRPEGVPGTLSINQLNNVFDFPVAVGIGIAGSASCLHKFNPNITTVFTPGSDDYSVVFGNYSVGQVIDSFSVSKALPVKFSPACPNHSVTLDSSNILRLSTEF